MSASEFIASIAWPLTVLVIALLFRAPLTHALSSSSGAVSAGPLRLEWKRQAAAIEADLGLPVSISEGKIGGAAGRLDQVANTDPLGAIVEAFRRVELSLRALLEEQGIEGLDESLGAELGENALTEGLISSETKDAIDGLSAMRNLAIHAGGGEVSPRHAHEFIALTQGVLYAISLNARSSSRQRSSS
jgi:hypothetical protein